MNAIRKHWAKLTAFACQDRLLVGASVFRGVGHGFVFGVEVCELALLLGNQHLE